jgi:NitT/TauT family transport system substrate-binding protein
VKAATSRNTPVSARRRFLSSASALSAASFLSLSRIAAAEAAPETTRIRLVIDEGICLAPQMLSAELLRLEGFAEVEYVRVNYEERSTIGAAVAAGDGDIAQDAAINLLPLVDAGQPVVILSGVHAGCWELFGGPAVRSIRDLKGKRIPIAAAGAEEHLLASSLSAYLGMDPRKDIAFVTIPLFDDQVKAFVAGDVDAMFAFPPQPQRLRVQQIGHVIIDSARDRPWTQYFCCAINANRNFVHRNPMATKRALRAILKAADICAQDPQRAARYLVDKGYEPRYETALEVLQKLPYRNWRDFDPEDTLRFHALRLREVGMVKSNPNKLIVEGTDWRYLNELKKELKG